MENKETVTTERDSFETGSTNPPKKRGGIIAVLLICVILLGGFVRGFGLFNIWPFAAPEPPGASILAEVAPIPVSGLPDPGFAGQTVSALGQRFHAYPDGVVVNTVTPKSSADSVGVVPGDVLVELDGQPITGEDTLQRVLSQHQPGDRLTAVFCRGETSYTCQLVLSPAQ